MPLDDELADLSHTDRTSRCRCFGATDPQVSRPWVTPEVVMWIRGLSLLVLVGCVDTLDVHEVAQPIVNGQIDGADLATVYLDVGCTGTLVSPRTVLTASHCLEPDIAVYLGTYAGDASGTWIDVVHASGHPTADLAMLTLAEAAPTTPARLNPHDLADELGRPIRIVGWGVTSETGGGDGTKRKAVATLDTIEGDLMYATNQPSGTCYGDSGGPSFMTIGGIEVVIGVTSFGTEDCGRGLDASVRVDSYHDWITAYIAAHDAVSPEPSCDPSDPDPACVGRADHAGTGPRIGDDVAGGCAASGGSAPSFVVVLALTVVVRRRRRSRHVGSRASRITLLACP